MPETAPNRGAECTSPAARPALRRLARMPLAMFGGCRDAFVLVHALVLALVLGDPRGALLCPCPLFNILLPAGT